MRDRGRNWSDVALRPGSQQPLEAEISMEQVLPQGLCRACGTADTLISGFWLSQLGEVNFCCLKPPTLW